MFKSRIRERSSVERVVWWIRAVELIVLGSEWKTVRLRRKSEEEKGRSTVMRSLFV